jgi:ribosomal protein S18 acetylase RimI-like enzyme
VSPVAARSIGAVTIDFERALSFVHLVQDRTSTRIEPFPWGSTVFNDDVPERYYSNFVRLPLLPDGVDAGAVAREADIAQANLLHRQILMDRAGDGERLAAGLAGHGYEGYASALLALRRAPYRDGDPDAVEQVSFAEIRPFEVEVSRRMLTDAPVAVAERFADLRSTIHRAMNGRFYAQRIDGQIAGVCELYVDGTVAQIENVDTLEEFRGRGVARNIMVRAVREARAAGCDLIFLDADVDDWPIGFYRRLGFDELGRTWAFTRWPAAA